MSNAEWFDDIGWLIREFPADCVESCSHQGECYHDCAFWIDQLDFSVPRDKAIDWLAEFGAWPRETNEYDKGLDDMDDRELAIKVIWLACGDIKENGDWCGLVH